MRSLDALIKQAKGARNIAPGQLVGTMPHPTVEYLYVELLETPQGRLVAGRVVDHTGAPVDVTLSVAQSDALARQIALQQQFLQRQAYAELDWNGSFARSAVAGRDAPLSVEYDVPTYRGDAKRIELFRRYGLPIAAPRPGESYFGSHRILYSDYDTGEPVAYWVPD